MALTELISFIGKDNIVDQVDEKILDKLGERVKRQFEEDKDSMGDWSEGVRESRELMKQEFHGKSDNWNGGSNFKTPLLIESSVAFGDKSSLELLRSADLVKSEIIGKDPQGQKKALAERITEAMNFQINHQMKWRTEQKRLLYCLPNDGTIFKTVFFDPLEQKTRSEIIAYPDFVVGQATKSMEDCRSFTQILDISKNEAEEKFRAKLWHGDIIKIYPEDADGDEGSNEAEGADNAMENTDRYLQQQCFADLDDDGYEEPYIVTLHEETNTIVRIVARYDEQSLIVRNKNGAVTDLVKAKQAQESAFIAELGGEENLQLIGMAPPSVDLSELKLVKIEPLVNIVKYGFIPSPNGTFLDLGYSHLLGAYAQTINATTNQLVDKATQSNMGGGFTAAGFRNGQKGPLRFKMGQFMPTSMSPANLRNSILPMPIGEPSQTLFALNQDIKSQADRFSVILNDSGQINANTAPTTALAMIAEQGITTSALMGRVLDSESDEFQILFRLNQRFFDPELYREILGDENADSRADFNSEMFNVVPTASAEMSSKLQRLQTSEVELLQFDRVLQSNGNPMPILRNYFEAVGGTPVDEIWPPEGSQLSPADQASKDQMLEAQKQANDMQQAQLQLQQRQTDLLEREQDRLDSKNQADIAKAMQDIETAKATAIKLLAEASLKGEEAETESLNNRINTYTAIQQSLQNALNTTGTLNAENNVRNINPLQQPSGPILLNG